MGGVVDDIVNPIGAITGVDPVKDATGFTGTGFEPKAGASNAPTAQLVGGSAGGGGMPSSSGAYLQQFNQQQAQPLAQFGQQLHQLATPQAQATGIGNIQSPSAQATAAAVTANSIQARQNPMQQAAQGPSQFWQSMWQ